MDKKINLLVIDDDEINTFIVEKMAIRTTHPVHVQCYNRGQKILDNLHAESKHIDVVLMDINMPQVNGWTLLNAFDGLKNVFTKNTHIYMVSATIYLADQEKIKQYPSVKDILLKPLSINKLQQIFDLFVQQKRLGS